MYDMDLQLVKKGLNYSHRRKKWVLLFAALGFTGYGAYKVYHTPYLVKKRKRLLKLLGALISIAEAVSDSAEAIGVLSKDFKEFIQLDSDQIPISLRQVSKITRSEEFSESVIRITSALTLGILRGYQSESRSSDSLRDNSSFSDQVLDKLFSKAGSGFASVVVGSFAKNLVMAFYSDGPCGGESNVNDSANVGLVGSETDSVRRWVDVACSDKCRELIGDSIQLFVSTAVAVYLDKTMHINTYDEIFSGLTNPKHETKVRDILASVCKDAVETLIRTSHQVLTSTNSNVSSNLNSSYYAIAIGQRQTNINKELGGQESTSPELETRNSFDKNQDSGWVGEMSSTLAVPSNRRFILDVTGRVTFETVRSFLEFLLEKLSDGLQRCLSVIHEEVVDRGIGILKYGTAKSSTIVTICFSLCLHILAGPWLLVPA